MSLLRQLTIGLACFCLCFSTLTWADTETENQALARFIHELDALNSQLTEAQASLDPATRWQFRYDVLRQDLKTIRHGVMAYINHNLNQPRTIPEMKGDYLDNK